MLRIKNVVQLDLTELTQETAKTIEQIENCVVALFSKKTAPLLTVLPFKNLVEGVILPTDCEVTNVNGTCSIGKEETFQGKRYYIVNGELVIQGDVTGEQLLNTIVGGIVNGQVLCSISQEQVLGSLGVRVNGNIASYPDGAMLYENDLTIDQGFITAAKDNSTHYTMGKILAMGADLNALKAKNITLLGHEMVVYKEDVLLAKELFSGKIVAIEKDCRLVMGEVKLNYAALRRYGKRIAVLGDVFISDDLDAMRLNEYLEKLSVHGDLILNEAILDDVLEKADEFHDLVVYEGRLLSNTGSLSLSKASLEGLNQPVSIWAVGNLEFKQDVTPQLFKEKVLGLYVFGNATVPEAIHGLALSLVKQLHGQLEPSNGEEGGEDAVPEGVNVIGNAVELKLV